MVDIFFDPQTAGGLLITLAANEAESLISKMHTCGIREAAIIGEIVTKPQGESISCESRLYKWSQDSDISRHNN